MKSYKLFFTLLFTLILISCKDDDYGKHSDIDFPIPQITSATPNIEVGKEITIEGKDFTVPNSVIIDGISMKIVSETDTLIKALLPRIFKSSPIAVQNAYGMVSEQQIVIAPIYPETQITEWPIQIVRGGKIDIVGVNVDLITEIKVNNLTIPVNGLTQKPNLISVLVAKNIEGTSTKMEVKTILGKIFLSTDIPIVDPPVVF